MSELSVLAKEIKKWVVSDYFTPNIKAEVILDTLLTPYVKQMLWNDFRRHSCGFFDEGDVHGRNPARQHRARG